MGVHTTFVRSVDLDEWTQPQIDAMRLGGNANAQQYFRKHGMTDMHGKIENKYNSKAAKAYRKELAKIMLGEAKPHTHAAPAPVDASSLMEKLELADKKAMEETARAKLAAAKQNNSASQQVVMPSAKLASTMAGASKLVVTPPTSGNAPRPSGGTAPKLNVLRKPTGNSTMKLLKKKPAGGLKATKLGANRLVMKMPTSSSNGNNNNTNSDSHFDDDVDDNNEANDATTTTTTAPAEPEPKQEPEPEPEPRPEPLPTAPVVANGAAAATNGGGGGWGAMLSSSAPAANKPAPQKFEMKDGISKMKAMNSDFFAGL